VSRRQHHSVQKTTKTQTMVYKTLHRKQHIEQHEPHLKPGMN
jgi:hypothetical protein